MPGRLRKRTQMVIDENMAITHANYVVIDIKLSGLVEEKNSILSIGAIMMSGGRIELGETFYRLLTPDDESPVANPTVPGVAQASLLLEQNRAPVLSEFLSISGNDILLGHLVSTDLAFLKMKLNDLLERR